MSEQPTEKPGLSETFREAAAKQPNPKHAKPAAPFSLRLTFEERAYLEEKAGNRPLGAYIRERLLGDRSGKRRRSRKPKLDDQKIALVLADLGRSRLASNLNQLAKAANMGTLDVSSEVERELQTACQAVATMRDILIASLGLKVEGGQ